MVENWASVQLSKSFQHKFDLFSEGQLPRGKDIIKQLLANVRPRQPPSPKKGKGTSHPHPVTVPYVPPGGWANWTPYAGAPPIIAQAGLPLATPGGLAHSISATSLSNSPILGNQPAPGPNEAGPGPGPLAI